MDSGVAPHSRGALISFCAGLLLAAPFRCRWPAFPLFRAASPCGLCPVARRQNTPWHAFYFISESTGCHKRTRCDECLNCLNPKLLKRFGCLSGKDNAATPAKKREVDLLQWGLDPAAEHRSPAEREDLVEPQSIRGGGAAGVRKHANPVAKPALDPKHSAQVAQLQKSSAS
jgi:hypothetical protein